MKKLLLTITLLTSPAFAFEDYIVVSPDAVRSVSVQHEDILDVNVLFTIDNEKKFVVISPKKTGKAKVRLLTDRGQKNINVDVSENSTKIETFDNLSCYLLDSPPANPYIPLPPANIILPAPPKGVK